MQQTHDLQKAYVPQADYTVATQSGCKENRAWHWGGRRDAFHSARLCTCEHELRIAAVRPKRVGEHKYPARCPVPARLTEQLDTSEAVH